MEHVFLLVLGYSRDASTFGPFWMSVATGIQSWVIGFCVDPLCPKVFKVGVGPHQATPEASQVRPRHLIVFVTVHGGNSLVPCRR